MGLGAGELVLILVIAYVVVGPEDMAKLARTIAKTIRQLRKMSSDLGKEVSGGLQLPAVPDLTGEITIPSVTDLTGTGKKVSGLNPAAADGKTRQNTLQKGTAASVSADFDSVLREIQKAEAELNNQRDV